jgi:hypothetical protein
MDILWILYEQIKKRGKSPLFGNLDERYFAMLTVNEVSTFGSLSTLTVPPSAVASDLTIASPMPAPPVFLVLDLSVL